MDVFFLSGSLLSLPETIRQTTLELFAVRLQKYSEVLLMWLDKAKIRLTVMFIQLFPHVNKQYKADLVIFSIINYINICFEA